MEQLPLFDELAIVAALAVAVTVVLARLKLPTVAGLLAAGAVLGPFGMKLVTSVKSIETLANVGVMLLLFSIGLEFSLARLRNIFQKVALGGALQVILTTLVITGLVVAHGQSIKRGIFYGFVFALSSTAIVLRALEERREVDAPHGRFIVGTLIFQDLCVIPMVLVVPLLGDGGDTRTALFGIFWALLKAVAVVVGAILAARYLVPRILGWVAAVRSREVFLLAILGICIGTAWLTNIAGLSLSLGAFVGGMVVADTEHSHRAMGNILPLRDAFLSLFFVSLGMLFDVRWVTKEPLLVGAILFCFFVVKGLVATIAALSMRFPARAAYLAGMGLAGFGEFGFVLTELGREHGVVNQTALGPLLAAGIISMFLTPLLVRVAPHITAGQRLLAPLERLIGVGSLDETSTEAHPLTDHVIIVGFGLAGRVAAESLASSETPFVVLEMGVENVRRGKQLGLPVYYGDATSEETLERVRLTRAHLLVLLINDPLAAERVVATARRVAPGVSILMRTRYLLEREGLLALGADDVVAEEVEGTVEIIARMLRAMETPRNVIEKRIQAVRSETQTSERKQTLPRSAMGELRGLEEMKIESFLVESHSPAIGQSPVSLQLRHTTGALVVGVRREQHLLEKPDPNIPFAPGDIVYCVGTGAAIRRVTAIFDPLAVSGMPPADGASTSSI
jgi:monovalent cation:H+ antiporter-2, CPA2 family